MAIKTFIIFSYGTFGFWSAFLKQQGDVILANGTSKEPTFLENLVRSFLPRWTFVSDPCFLKDSEGNIQVIDNCQ
jgi:hypothetical protein